MKRSAPWKGLLALALAVGSAYAQPANDPCTGAIEMSGSYPQLTTPVDFSTCAAAAEAPMCSGSTYTVWYKLVAQNSGTLTVSTCAADAPANTWADTVVAIFESGDGTCDTLTGLSCLDDSCGLRQSLSVSVSSGLTYYIQAGKYAAGAPTAGAMIQLKVTAPNLIEPPTGQGFASPATFNNCAATDVLLEVVTTPGNSPAATVSIDLSTLGGSGSQAMADPDGDGIFAYTQTVAAGWPIGTYPLGFTVADSDGRSSTGSVGVTITLCPPPPATNDACTDAIALTGSFPQVTAPTDIAGCVPTPEFVMCVGSSYSVWYKVVAQNNGTITVRTCAADTPATTVGDTVLAIYESGDGSCDTLTQLACNDDACGLRSTTSAAAISGMTYYIQAAKYATAAPAAGFSSMQVWVSAPNAVEPPTGVGQASPNTADNCSGAQILFQVATTPGNLPASTVTLDLSSLGGSGSQSMTDLGGVFEYLYTLPNGVAAGGRALGFTVADSNGRSSTGSIAFTVTPCPPQDPWFEVGDAGDLPDSAQVPEGSGSMSGIVGTFEASDADMYLIDICDLNGFSATTTVFTTADTQLWLFNLDGTGVEANDDHVTGTPITLQSTLTNQFVPAAGQYYLAVSQYNRDPVNDIGQALFLNDFRVEHPSNGPGAGTPVAAWTGTTTGAASYTITLSGTCYPGGGCPACAADFNQDGGVDGADVEAFYLVWEAGEACGDVNQDGGVDGGDVEAFYVVWEAGGCD